MLSFLMFEAGEIVALLPRSRWPSFQRSSQTLFTLAILSTIVKNCRTLLWQLRQAVFGVVGLVGVDDEQSGSPDREISETRGVVHARPAKNDEYIHSSLKLVVVVFEPQAKNDECIHSSLKLVVVVFELIARPSRPCSRSRWPYFQRSLRTLPWPLARNSFKKPRLSQIVQIQSNLQKSNANKLLFYKKQNVNSFLLSQRFLE